MPIPVYRGDNKTLRISITSRNVADPAQLDPVDTTGWQIDFTLRETDDAVASLVVKSSAVPGEIDPVDASQGVWDLKILPGDTDLPVAEYVWDVQATTDDAPPKIYTVAKGVLRVLQDVTR